jgi:hypothetical protein
MKTAKFNKQSSKQNILHAKDLKDEMVLPEEEKEPSGL